MKLILVRQFILSCFIFTPLLGVSQITKELRAVGRMMHGKFSSERQSKSDSAFFDIRLSILPIWTERSDAIWMYVEQAVSNKLDKPYRQRVYRITQLMDGSFESAVFTLKDPLRFAGKVELFESLNPDSLELRDGCSVFLKKIGKRSYEGATGYKTCPSDMRGAAYASSIVTLNSTMLLSWDRGFDRNDTQVWGAEKEGYKFLRVRK
jgi:CpeT protein